MKNLIVSELVIYPIKSCRGITLKNTLLEEKGLQYDRRWMVTDAHGKFLTQRTIPQMALISVTMLDQYIKISAPQMPELLIPLNCNSCTKVNVEIWNDRCKALNVNKEADDWFSQYLCKEYQFVFMPNESIRNINTIYSTGKHSTAFSDALPVLLIPDVSLEDLNSRLSVPLPMNRFRPNIMVKEGSHIKRIYGKKFE